MLYQRKEGDQFFPELLVYILIFVFRQSGEKTNDSKPNGGKQSSNLICSYFLMNKILIFYYSQILELHHIFKESISFFMLRLCPGF
jgi:hypothetical protein